MDIYLLENTIIDNTKVKETPQSHDESKENDSQKIKTTDNEQLIKPTASLSSDYSLNSHLTTLKAKFLKLSTNDNLNSLNQVHSNNGNTKIKQRTNWIYE